MIIAACSGWRRSQVPSSGATLARIPENSDYLEWPKTFFHHRDLTDDDFRAMVERIDA